MQRQVYQASATIVLHHMTCHNKVGNALGTTRMDAELHVPSPLTTLSRMLGQTSRETLTTHVLTPKVRSELDRLGVGQCRMRLEG